MKLKKLAVIATADDGKTYQVALSRKQLETLANALPYYFEDGIIKVTNELEEVRIVESEETEN